MDISGISASTMTALVNSGGDVGTTVLKKANDIQKREAAQLLAAIPTPPRPDPASPLGQHVNVKA